ncbi:uncharacterized protein V1518DRAFT_408651 [Limtongia smithiae]|uniref:uncharacterized protein n=1 Tax=Limtongia smithiae TaxID=1125753 RepID=UPI0034CFA48F
MSFSSISCASGLMPMAVDYQPPRVVRTLKRGLSSSSPLQSPSIEYGAQQHYLSPSPTPDTKRQRKSYSAPMPSCVSLSERSRTLALPTNGDISLYAYPPGSLSYTRIQPQALLHQTNGPTVLVFFANDYDEHVHELGGCSARLHREFDAGVYAVGTTMPVMENKFAVPLVLDTKTCLTRLCRALHPLAGGRDAMPLVTVLDRQGRVRAYMPVGYGGHRGRQVPVERILREVVDVLAFLKWEE